MNGLVRGCGIRFSHASRLTGVVGNLAESFMTGWPRKVLKDIEGEKSGAYRKARDATVG